MKPSLPPVVSPSDRRRRFSPLLFPRRFFPLALAALCASLALSGRAGAAPFTFEPDPDPFDAFLDLTLGEHPIQDAPAGVLAVGISASMHLSPQSSSFGAFGFLQLPFGRLLAPGRRDLASLPIADRTAPRPRDAGLPIADRTGPRPREKPALPPAEAPPRAVTPPSAPTADVAAAPSPAALLTPELARGAVGAACKAARLDEADSRLDRLASRAKTSALLPELRLRATRMIDESESIAPTEYDPTRRTASGGATTWLEARATFRLDRLVFADDELAVERLRMARAAERTKLVAKVLELLDAWQRARSAEANQDARPEVQSRAALTAAASEASLDVLTNGWFSKALVKSNADGARPDASPAREPNAPHDAPHPSEPAPPSDERATK